MKKSVFLVIFLTLTLISEDIIAQQVLVRQVTMHEPTIDKANWIVTKADPSTQASATSCPGAITDPLPLDPKAYQRQVLVYFRGSSNQNSSKLPAAYVSGCKANVRAEFSDPDKLCNNNIGVYVKGVAITNVGGTEYIYTLPVKQLDPLAKYPQTEFNESFPKNLIQYHENFNIHWYYSLDPASLENANSSSVEWKDAGISDCFIMITYKEPIKEQLTKLQESTKFFLTALYLSCKATNGLTPANDDEAIKAFFEPFRAVDGQMPVVSKHLSSAPLQYWGGRNPFSSPACRTIEGLLAYRDANCGEWAGFFQNILKVHGISTGKPALIYWQDFAETSGVIDSSTEAALMDDLNSVFGTTNAPTITLPKSSTGKIRSYIFVNKQKFTEGARKFYLLNPEHSHECDLPTGTNSIITPKNVVINSCNDVGIPAQGNSDPKSSFRNHAMVHINSETLGTYGLDPSYGAPNSTGSIFTNWADYESAAIAGFGVEFKYLSNTGKLYTILWVYELNKPEIQISFSYE